MSVLDEIRLLQRCARDVHMEACTVRTVGYGEKDITVEMHEMSLRGQIDGLLWVHSADSKCHLLYLPLLFEVKCQEKH